MAPRGGAATRPRRQALPRTLPKSSNTVFVSLSSVSAGLVERARAAKPKAAAHAAVAVSRKRPAEKKEPVAAAAPKPAPHPFDEPSRAPPPPSNAPPSSSYQWDSSYPAGGFRVGAAAGDPALFGNPYASFGRKQSTSKPPAFPPSPERANAVPANPVERARAQRRGSVPAMND